jgi:hypothetical protein
MGGSPMPHKTLFLAPWALGNSFQLAISLARFYAGEVADQISL